MHDALQMRCAAAPVTQDEYWGLFYCMSRYFFLVDVSLRQSEGLEQQIPKQVEKEDMNLVRRYTPILQNCFYQKWDRVEWDFMQGSVHNMTVESAVIP